MENQRRRHVPPRWLDDQAVLKLVEAVLQDVQGEYGSLLPPSIGAQDMIYNPIVTLSSVDAPPSRGPSPMR